MVADDQDRETATADDGAAEDANVGRPLPFDLVAQCVGHASAVGAVAISQRTNNFIITASKDTTLKRWDLTLLEDAEDYPVQLAAKYTIRAHEKDINTLAVAPNDKIVASGSQDKTIKV
jgi:U3 small nucleolar RNA-associated protein 13